MSSSSYDQENPSSGSRAAKPSDVPQNPSWSSSGATDSSAQYGAGSDADDRPAGGEFGKILADLQDLVARAGNVSGEDLAQVRGQIADKFLDAKEKVSEMTDDALAATRKGADATEDMIRSHPFPAVAIAVLAGLAVGIMLARR